MEEQTHSYRGDGKKDKQLLLSEVLGASSVNQSWSQDEHKGNSQNTSPPSPPPVNVKILMPTIVCFLVRVGRRPPLRSPSFNYLSIL